MTRSLLARRLCLYGALTGLVAACASNPPPDVAPVSQGGKVTVIEESVVDPTQPQVLLPAYLTAAEHAAFLKSDAAANYRIANKQWFANTVPLEQGRFRAFQEWEEMKDVWMTYSSGTSSNGPVRRLFAEQTIAFLRYSTPKMNAKVIIPAKSSETVFKKALVDFGATPEELARVEYIVLPNQTIWHIDYGPFPLVDKTTNTLAFSEFNYYPERFIDDAVPTRLATEYYKDISTYRMPFDFEGGNLQADGMGNCATTVRALSNTGYSQEKVRSLLKHWAACENTIIVKDIDDDGTGHIDMFFKWIDVDHVMFGQYEDNITLDYNGDGTDETIPLPGSKNAGYKVAFARNKQRMEDNVKLFEGLTAPNGKKYTVSRLTMMTWYKDSWGDLPRTFINSTFANGVNAYPSYAKGSCQDPDGAVCMDDSDCCANFADCGQHCAAGKCTKGTTAEGCEDLLPCEGKNAAKKAYVCVDDPVKVALIAKAQKQWEAAMPTWKHVGLRADVTATWSGAIHCITRTIPNKKGGKVFDDGQCLNGQCDCVEGGTTQKCESGAECVGPAWRCDCNECMGTCPNGKVCAVDWDCTGVKLAGDPTPVATTDGAPNYVPGSCKIDPRQACYGGVGPCGDVPFEGACSGSSYRYCDKGSLKTVTCPAATKNCGWIPAQGTSGCKADAACVDECTEGQTGCSVTGTHAWTCAKSGTCFVRKWSECSTVEWCDPTAAKCVSKTDVQYCPGVVPPDTTDTSTTDTTGADTAIGDTGADTMVKPVTPAASSDSGGCTAGPTGGPTGLAWLFFAALALVAGRRRFAR
ncbi:MAG: agmatine deiminase family protein [Myxococcota bacterium]